jgi:hypothetical protein
MSRLELFLRELKLTPKQAKSPFSPNTYRRRKSSINSLRRKEKTKPKERIKEVIQEREKKQEIEEAKKQAKYLPENNNDGQNTNSFLSFITGIRDTTISGILGFISRNIEKYKRKIFSASSTVSSHLIDTVEQQAEEESLNLKKQEYLKQNEEQNLINDMDIERVAKNIKGENIRLEIDLGCNDMDDKEEEDNEDNEICKTTFNNQLGQQIDLNSKIKRIGSKPSLRNQQTIQTRIFDVVHDLYGQGKLKAEVQNGVITIYKTDSLIERIENTFNEYVYDDNTQITLTKSDINSILLDGVEKTIKTTDIKYKIELPKPKLKRVVVGENNVDFFDTVVKCDKNPKDNGCGLYSDLTALYGYLNTAGTEEQKKELKLSVILWFDTHHDFKEDRYKDAKNVWNDKFKVNGREETFITWYAKKFFIPFEPYREGTSYSFSNNVSQTILGPVVTFNNGSTLIPTLIPTLLYRISHTYLQNRVFEKKILLHYIVHNFAVTPNNSTTLLRDILYVHRKTYNDLLSTPNAPANSKIKGILQQAEEISNNNDPQKEKKLKAVVLKLKQLNNLFGGANDTDFGNITNITNITNIINTVIPKMLNTKEFTFVEGRDTLPNFISSADDKYVNDAGESKYPLNKEVQYVPAALFDANKSNTYEPADEEKYFDHESSSTKYDDFILGKNYNNTPRLDTTYEYHNNKCKLEITPSPRTFNKALTKADIRCSKNPPLVFPDDQKYNAILIRYLKGKGINEAIFIEKMYEVLTKFVPGDGKQFVLEPNMTKIIPPKFFNSIKTGPSAQSLVFLTILYRLDSINTFTNPTGDLPLELIDNIVNLKRLGDYGQVIDAKMANLPFFTIDSMESLMCIIEKVSCYIDFNQGVIIYDNGGDDGGFIRSKGKTRDSIYPPGYEGRPPPPVVQGRR